MSDSRSTLRPALVAMLGTLLLCACGSDGGSSGGPSAPVISAFDATPSSIQSGSSATLSWTVSGATALSISPVPGTVTGTSVAVSPTATTTYTLTAGNSAGSVTRTATVTVTAAPSLEPACSGASCGAASATQYSGSGIGVWRYVNGTAGARTIDIGISGVSAGQQAALVFTNPSTLPLAIPSAGTLASPPLAMPFLASAPDVDPVEMARERWHLDLLEMNRQLVETLGSGSSQPRAVPAAAPAPAPAPVQLGDTRAWSDLTTTPPTSYSATARVICSLPGGRRGVFWVDPGAETSGSFTPAAQTYFQTTFCGATGNETSGGYGRVRALLGEPWGALDPTQVALYISDAVGLQDVNVVFLQVGGTVASKTWAGYFHGGNNYQTTTYPGSNQALAFFIDASLLPTASGYLQYLAGALLHELTHMINFYQRSVFRGMHNQTWLEETTATMTEDIVVPVATPDNYSLTPGQRVRPYVGSGGGMTYTGWLYPAEYTYGIAGSFAGFLDRRYGVQVLQETITCPGTGVDCFDAIIQGLGGSGFADEFARMGASVFALVPATGAPSGYGYPQTVDGGYTLGAIDLSLSTYVNARKGVANALTTNFPGGSHTYQLDTVAAGHTAYTRTGVVVPAGGSVHLVIR